MGAAEGEQNRLGFFLKKLNAEVSRLEGIYRNLLKNSGVQTFDQHAKVVDAHTIELESGKQITSEYILLATGGKRTYRYTWN